MVAVRGGVEGGPPGGDGEVICGIYLLGLLGTNASAQRWKKRQTLQTRLCYFSQLVLIFRPGARKTMREECYTHCIISTRAISTSAISTIAISTSAISTNSAFSCNLQIFHSFIG